MRIGRASTMLPNFGGGSWSSAIGQYPETDLHLALIEAACAYREGRGSEASSITLLDILAQFMGKVDIFRPIIEVWECTRKVQWMDEGTLPIGHKLAGKRGIHVPPSYVERKSDGWTEQSTIVLSEDLHWGIVWSPKDAPHSLSIKDFRKQRTDHYRYESASSSELASLKFRAGGDIWGITNSLCREVMIARERAEYRLKYLLGLGQTLVMAEQITSLPEKK